MRDNVKQTWLSLLLGDRPFIEEKSYWMHEQNYEFTRQRDECIRQMQQNVEEEKRRIYASYFLCYSHLNLRSYDKLAKIQKN